MEIELLTIYLYSIYRKGREKGQFLGISYFWIEVCFSFTLRRNHLHSLLFKLRRDCMQMLVPYGISLLLFVLFCVQNLCCNDSKYHSLNWKDVSVTNVDIFEKKQFSLQFLYSLLQVYIVHRVSFIFHLNVFLVSVCARGFGYLLCWPRGRGIGLVYTRRFSFHEFCNFLLFNFLIFIFLEDFFFTHDNYPHPHPRPTPTTHELYPRPTTHDI